jgi:cyclase
MGHYKNNIRIIPSLLLKNKRLVKGKVFKDFIDAGDPIKTCVAHDSQYCDEISIIDLDAYHNKVEPDYETLKLINKEINTPILFGGNINNIKIVEKLIKNGADKVLINSNLFSTNIALEVINNFGKQALVGGVDLFYKENKYYVYQNGKLLNINYLQYIKNVIELGVGEIKITFVKKEGTRKGFDIEEANKISKTSQVPIIFEGGIKNLQNILDAITNNVNAIAIGSLLIFSDNNIFKVKQFLDNRNIKVRLRF